MQLREKDLPARDLFDMACQVKEMAKRYGARVLVNDRIDIAMAAGLDGVHLPADSFTAAEARKLMRGGKIIGVSTHSLQEAVKAEKEGADFITFSPVYETPSKVRYGKPQGIGNLENVCRNISIPVYALGGIKGDNIKDVKKAGSYGIALISYLMGANDVRAAAEEICNLAESEC